ncbi:MAG: MFS transporter [Chloroflexi bacterium]|nr:MFS transporter [Chloroflexota bacterium]
MARSSPLAAIAGALPGRSDLAWMGYVGVALFFYLLPSNSYVAAVPVLQEQWSLSNIQTGIIYSAFVAGYALSALAVIPLTDRLNSKSVLYGSGILSIVSYIAFPLFADGLITAIVIRAVQGIGLVGVYMPSLRIIAERFPRKGRGLASGFYVTVGYGGFSLSLLFTGALMNFVDWDTAYLILGIIAIVCAPVAYALLRKHEAAPATRSSGRLDLKVFKHRTVRFMVAGYTIHTLEVFTIQIWIPLFMAAVLISRGYSTVSAAAVASAMAGLAFTIAAVGPLFGGILSDRLGRAKTLAGIAAIAAACGWGFGWLGDAPWALIVFVAVIYGLVASADSAIFSAALIDTLPRHSIGSALAALSFLGFMGGVVGPIALGGIRDFVPESISWPVSFSVIALLTTLAVFLFTWLHWLEKGKPLPIHSESD